MQNLFRLVFFKTTEKEISLNIVQLVRAESSLYLAMMYGELNGALQRCTMLCVEFGSWLSYLTWSKRIATFDFAHFYK